MRRAVSLWLPWMFVATMLAMKVLSPDAYRWCVAEDGPVEWATAVAFAVASVFALRLSRRLGRNSEPLLATLYGLLGVGLAFMMLEEISWGQRIFGMEAPSYFVENSSKPETNVHNLKWFPLGLAFILVGFYGAFARALLPADVARRYPLHTRLLTPGRELVSYFLLIFAIYVYFEIIYYTVMLPNGITVRRNFNWTGYVINGKDQEGIEFLLALGFLLFVTGNWRSYSKFERQTGAADANQSGSAQDSQGTPPMRSNDRCPRPG